MHTPDIHEIKATNVELNEKLRRERWTKEGREEEYLNHKGTKVLADYVASERKKSQTYKS